MTELWQNYRGSARDGLRVEVFEGGWKGARANGTDHHHDHDAHAEIGSGARPGYYDMMEAAVRELLVEKKLIGADEIRREDRVLDSRTPALGAKVVARAWVNPDFRRRLLAHGRAALRSRNSASPSMTTPN